MAYLAWRHPQRLQGRTQSWSGGGRETGVKLNPGILSNKTESWKTVSESLCFMSLNLAVDEAFNVSVIAETSIYFKMKDFQWDIKAENLNLYQKCVLPVKLCHHYL